MHPDIVKFPNEQFYGGRIKTSYLENKLTQNIVPFQIIHVDGNEKKINNSFNNTNEIEKVIQCVNDLLKSFHDVVVITPYNAQLYELKKKLNVPVHTVDSFQGREADAVVLSTVRSGNTVGFWKDYRRVNVALTRAKHVMRIIGDTKTWKKDNSPLSSLVSN